MGIESQSPICAVDTQRGTESVLGHETESSRPRDPCVTGAERAGGKAQGQHSALTLGFEAGYLRLWCSFVFVTQWSGTVPHPFHPSAVGKPLLLTLDIGEPCPWKQCVDI